jgi:hypothetical protein
MRLEQTLASLADIVVRHLPLVLVGLALVLGAVASLCQPGQTSAPRGVRKGVCPCCGSALFGTTRDYQQLPGLERVCPESPYLCLTCDRTKIAAVQQHYHAERAEGGLRSATIPPDDGQVHG